MWRGLLLVALGACGTNTASNVGDARCASDAECPSGQRCVRVGQVRLGTGECLESSGVDVCRPVCADCTQGPVACGCQCP